MCSEKSNTLRRTPDKLQDIKCDDLCANHKNDHLLKCFENFKSHLTNIDSTSSCTSNILDAMINYLLDKSKCSNQIGVIKHLLNYLSDGSNFIEEMHGILNSSEVSKSKELCNEFESQLEKNKSNLFTSYLKLHAKEVPDVLIQLFKHEDDLELTTVNSMNKNKMLKSYIEQLRQSKGKCFKNILLKIMEMFILHDIKYNIYNSILSNRFSFYSKCVDSCYPMLEHQPKNNTFAEKDKILPKKHEQASKVFNKKNNKFAAANHINSSKIAIDDIDLLSNNHNKKSSNSDRCELKEVQSQFNIQSEDRGLFIIDEEDSQPNSNSRIEKLPNKFGTSKNFNEKPYDDTIQDRIKKFITSKNSITSQRKQSKRELAFEQDILNVSKLNIQSEDRGLFIIDDEDQQPNSNSRIENLPNIFDTNQMFNDEPSIDTIQNKIKNSITSKRKRSKRKLACKQDMLLVKENDGMNTLDFNSTPCIKKDFNKLQANSKYDNKSFYSEQLICHQSSKNSNVQILSVEKIEGSNMIDINAIKCGNSKIYNDPRNTYITHDLRLLTLKNENGLGVETLSVEKFDKENIDFNKSLNTESSPYTFNSSYDLNEVLKNDNSNSNIKQALPIENIAVNVTHTENFEEKTEIIKDILCDEALNKNMNHFDISVENEITYESFTKMVEKETNHIVQCSNPQFEISFKIDLPELYEKMEDNSLNLISDNKEVHDTDNIGIVKTNNLSEGVLVNKDANNGFNLNNVDGTDEQSVDDPEKVNVLTSMPGAENISNITSLNMKSMQMDKNVIESSQKTLDVLENDAECKLKPGTFSYQFSKCTNCGSNNNQNRGALTIEENNKITDFIERSKAAAKEMKNNANDTTQIKKIKPSKTCLSKKRKLHELIYLSDDSDTTEDEIPVQKSNKKIGKKQESKRKEPKKKVLEKKEPKKKELKKKEPIKKEPKKKNQKKEK